MIELQSIGDRLIAGDYQIHSSFARAVNFEQANALVSVVDEHVGPGPFNIVISGAPVTEVHSLKLGDQHIYINGEKIAYNDCPYYNSQIDLLGVINLKKFFTNLMTFENRLLAESASNSLVFLFRSESEMAFSTNFERELANRFRSGVGTILQGNIFDGVRNIRGLGFGLTPSGDDFISGMMYAIRLHGLLLGKDFRLLISRIYNEAIGGNSISNAFLNSAKEGWLPVRQKMLVKAILYGDEQEVRRRTANLLTIGETSGSDWATGFLLILKKAYRLL